MSSEALPREATRHWRKGRSAMVRNYIAAALRNLVRNRAYAAINLLGLALGYTAAILIALYVRDEFTFDQSFPQADRIYSAHLAIGFPGN